MHHETLKAGNVPVLERGYNFAFMASYTVHERLVLDVFNFHFLIVEGLLPSNLLAPVIGGAVGSLILVIFVIVVVVVVIVTLVRQRGSNNDLR